MLVAVPEGAHAMRLGNEASISQGIKLRQGSYYSLTFSAARTCAQSERLNVSVPPFSGNISIQTVYSIKRWDAYAWAFRAPSNAVVVIFHNPGVEEDRACGPVLDAVAIKEMFPPKFTELNLIKNGDFEEGPYMFPSSNSGVLLTPNDVDAVSPLPGWIVDSLKAVKYIDAEHFAVPQGRRAVELVNGKESAISQIVRTIPGKLYRLSFAVGDARNNWKLDSADAPCNWDGISCGNSSGMVIEITLEDKSLNGPLYSGLCNLRSLKNLHLGFNHLYGILPLPLMNCSNLESLDLNTNSLSGTLPDFSGLKSLKILDLTTNNFMGQIPASLGNLPELASLNLNLKNM